MSMSPLPLAVLIALALATPASALTVKLDDFAVTKNGNVIFDDGFVDGVPPPSAPNFSNGNPTFYVVQGSFPAGSEAGGFLTLNTANGMVGPNIVGDLVSHIGATLFTPSSGTNSLTKSDTIDVEGDFLLQTPAGPLSNGYDIEVVFESAPLRFAELAVTYAPALGQAVIAYALADFATSTTTVLGFTPLVPPLGADEIALEIRRDNTTNNNFFAN